MTSYPVMDHAYIGREICRTSAAVRIIEKQRIVHTVEYPSGQRPVDDLVMLLFGIHVVYVLRIVSASYSSLHACELIFLFYDVPHITAVADSCKLPVCYIRAVHNDCCHCPHARLPFAACWNQLKAAFNLANIKELPQEWIPDALAWVQAKIDALPKALPPQPERLPLYRNGCFYPPHHNRSHVPGPQEAALLELWQDWTRREAGLRQEFMAMLRELDARRGDLFSYAVSDLGRNADTMFSTQCLLDSLFQSRTEAEQRFRQALDDASLHLRLSLNVAVALRR